MSDDHQSEDSEGEDTRVVRDVDAPSPTTEGTLEMDRGKLFERLQGDRQGGEGARDAPEDEPGGENEYDSLGQTAQLPAIQEATLPSATTEVPSVGGPDTQHYEVPDHLIDRLKEPPARETRPLQANLCEFRAVVDENGNIEIPDRHQRRFSPGAKVVVVMRLDSDE